MRDIRLDPLVRHSVSLLFGVLYLRTRSIWPCFLAHVVNNLFSGWLVAG
jgi:membrane protease YdiL (CAAX protease family)